MSSFDDNDDRNRKAPVDERGSVRSRVTRHMTRLLVPSVIGLGACNNNTVVCDPLPPPMDASTEGPDANPVACDPLPPPIDAGGIGLDDAGQSPDGSVDAGFDADASPVVCDPLPPPNDAGK